MEVLNNLHLIFPSRIIRNSANGDQNYWADYPGMTLNCIWWTGSSSSTLVCVEYSFIVINPRSTLIQNGSSCYGHVYELNRSIR